MNTITMPGTGAHHPVATRDDWLVQRRELLAREKALTQQRDQIARDRRALPWVRMDKPYVFDTLAGRRTLSELFGDKRQLMVQHFMLAPGWEQGCKSCSFMADHLVGAQVHLEQRDLAVTLVSRAPLAEIQRFRQRMGWQFEWVSSHGGDFNLDFAVSFPPESRVAGEVDYNYRRMAFPQDEAPGISFFCKDDAGAVFHTYSTFGRGVEAMMMTYDLLDMAPLGRGEEHDAYGMEWVLHHDRYESASVSHACCASGA